MPYTVPNSAIPFKLHVADEDILRFRHSLEAARVGPPTWENQQEDRRYGVTHDWISSTKDYWLNEYNWRVQEAYLNSFPSYIMTVHDEKGDMDLHFVGLFSEKSDAIPIVLLHGWPGSFIEFLPMLDLVRQRHELSSLPYHIVVPSLPGFTLSSAPPKDKAWTAQDTARIINTAMGMLGFHRYIAQGGDIGSLIATLLGLAYDSAVAVHLNLLPSLDHSDPNDSSYTAKEKHVIERMSKISKTTTAAAIEQSTRPATIGFVISSNPLALLGWIGEKFLEWTEVDPSIDQLLTNVSLYWFTNCFSNSIYTYRDNFNEKSEYRLLDYIDKPFGFSWFMNELVPGPRKIVEKKGRLVFYCQHERGGHFAAFECPETFLQDIENFVKVAWRDIAKSM